MQADAHYRQIHSRVGIRLNFTVKALGTSHMGWLQVLQGLLQVHNKLLENINCEGQINKYLSYSEWSVYWTHYALIRCLGAKQILQE